MGSIHIHNIFCSFVDTYTQARRNGILLPKLFWPTVRKNCFSDREKLGCTINSYKFLQSAILQTFVFAFMLNILYIERKTSKNFVSESS